MLPQYINFSVLRFDIQCVMLGQAQILTEVECASYGHGNLWQERETLMFNKRVLHVAFASPRPSHSL